MLNMIWTHFLLIQWTIVFQLIVMFLKSYLNILHRKPKYLFLLLFLSKVTFIYSLYFADYNQTNIYVSTIQNIAKDIKKTMIVTFTNHAQINIVKHFLCNLGKHKLENQIVVITTDKESFSTLLKFKAISFKVCYLWRKVDIFYNV